MDSKEEKKLLRKWKKSDLWPSVDEESTSITGPEGNPRGYTRFCPEVLFNLFGYFTEHLHEYIDEIDRDSMIRRLTSEGCDEGDYRWKYMSISPLHFTDCPLYSNLQEKSSNREDLVDVKPNIWGFGLNLNEFFRRYIEKP